MPLLVLLLFSLARAAPPDAPVEPVETVSDAPDAAVLRPFAAALEEAKTTYFAGGHQEALDLLLALRARFEAGEELQRAEVAEALTYLGEVQLTLGLFADGLDTFELLLREWPDQEISAYAHPQEVVEYYLAVQRDVQREIEAANRPPPPPVAPPRPPRLPAWGYLPLGIPQYAQGRTGRGTIYATSQATLLAGSFGAYAWLARQGKRVDFNDENRTKQLNRVRFGVQWPLAIGFWTVYAASVSDGRGDWRRAHRQETTVNLVPTEGGGTALVVGGRF